MRRFSALFAAVCVAVLVTTPSVSSLDTLAEAPTTPASNVLTQCYEIELNTSSDSTASPAMPRMAALKDSSFLVTWKAQAKENLPAGIYVQRMSVSGKKRGMEILVSDDVTGHTGAPGNPDIAVHVESGRFGVTWIAVDADGHMPPEVFFRAFDYNGFPLSSSVKVSNNENYWNIFSASVVSMANGTYVVSWIEKRSVSVRGQGRLQYVIFGSVGELRSATPVLVYNDTGMAHDVMDLPGNNFVITWQAWVSDSQSEHLSIHAQVRNVYDGSVVVDARKISQHLTGVQQNPSLIRVGANKWLTIWAMHDLANAYEGIFSQSLNNSLDRLNNAGRDVEVDDVNIHSLFSGNCLDFPHATVFPNGDYAIAWTVYDGAYVYPYCRAQRRGVCVQAYKGTDNTRINMGEPCFDVGNFGAIQPLNTPRARLNALPNGDLILAYYMDGRGVVLRKFSTSTAGCQVAKEMVNATGAWVLIVLLFLLCGAVFGAALWWHKKYGYARRRSMSNLHAPAGAAAKV